MYDGLMSFFLLATSTIFFMQIVTTNLQLVDQTIQRYNALIALEYQLYETTITEHEICSYYGTENKKDCVIVK